MKALSKFIFKIRTKNGVLVENLQIPAINLEAAERNLRQMYVKCEIISLETLDSEVPAIASYETVLDLIVRSN